MLANQDPEKELKPEGYLQLEVLLSKTADVGSEVWPKTVFVCGWKGPNSKKKPGFKKMPTNMWTRHETESAGDDVVPGVTATRDFNFPCKTRLLNIHMLANTGDTSSLAFLSKGCLASGLEDKLERVCSTQTTETRSGRVISKISSCQRCKECYCLNPDMLQAMWVHNITCCECSWWVRWKWAPVGYDPLPWCVHLWLLYCLAPPAQKKMKINADSRSLCFSETLLMYHSLTTAFSSLLSGIRVCFFMKRGCLFSRWQPRIFTYRWLFTGCWCWLVLVFLIRAEFSSWWCCLRILDIIQKSMWV